MAERNRTDVAALVLIAIDALPAGDSRTVGVAVGRLFRSRSKHERTRLTATIAWAAADFAHECTPEQRKRVLDRLASDDAALVEQAVHLLIGI